MPPTNPPARHPKMSKYSFKSAKGPAPAPQPISSPAPAASAELNQICLVCADVEPKYWALAECGHKICHICSLRLRALYGSKSCPICKTENESVIICKSFEGGYQKNYQLKCPETTAYAIRYENQIVKTDCEVLLEQRCPKNKCMRVCRDRNDLQKHVQSAHDLLICEICLQHKKCFSIELELFTRATLTRHQNSGDGKTFFGHPTCPVCASHFYGEDELAEHCRLKHELCHICQRNNRPNRYFRDYNRLEEHFAKEHFLCPEPMCKELKFVVFESEIEYKRHLAEVHLAHQKMQRSQQHQLQRLNISFSVGPSTSNNQQSSTQTTSQAPQPRLTPDQRAQIASTLVFGQVTDDLASRMQSLSLYQQRNEQFMDTLRVEYHLSLPQIQGFLKDCRSFQRSEIDAVEMVNRIDALLGAEKCSSLLSSLSELQLDGLRKRELDAAAQTFKQKTQSFPALAPVKPSSNLAWNSKQQQQSQQQKKKVIAPFSGGVLQIKPAASNRNTKALSAEHDPSRNPGLLLRELAGGPSKPQKKQSQPAVHTPERVTSFSSATLGHASSRIVPHAKKAQTIASQMVDDEEFPSLLGASSSKPSVSESFETQPTNAFSSASLRDEFESFTIGNDAQTEDEKAPATSSSGKKNKKVVFRYGQRWDI